MTMDELELATLVGLMVESVMEDSALPENAQIIVRPIFTWPDGKPGVWVMVNWPN
jgi:hypothetical protein